MACSKGGPIMSVGNISARGTKGSTSPARMGSSGLKYPALFQLFITDRV